MLLLTSSTVLHPARGFTVELQFHGTNHPRSRKVYLSLGAVPKLATSFKGRTPRNREDLHLEEIFELWTPRLTKFHTSTTLALLHIYYDTQPAFRIIL